MGKFLVRFCLCSAVLGAFISYAAQERPEAQDQYLAQLQAQGSLMRSAVSEKTLKRLIRLGNKALEIGIPKKELVGKLGNRVPVKKVLNKYSISTIDPFSEEIINPWKDQRFSEKIWQKMYQRADIKGPQDFYKKLEIGEIPGLLQDVKYILKSFLSGNEELFAGEEIQSEMWIKRYCVTPHFIVKPVSLLRLFTYANLERAIREKKLSHVHLPTKILRIYDWETETYLSQKEALRLLDDSIAVAFKATIEASDQGDDSWGDFGLSIGVLGGRRYEMKIWAHKQRDGVALNKLAREELQVLVQKAPFDIGYHNIFTDKQGDAVIIDTEDKGEPAEHCLEKIKSRL